MTLLENVRDSETLFIVIWKFFIEVTRATFYKTRHKTDFVYAHLTANIIEKRSFYGQSLFYALPEKGE